MAGAPDVSIFKAPIAIYGLKQSEFKWYKDLRTQCHLQRRVEEQRVRRIHVCNSNGTRIYAPNAIFNGGWKSSEYEYDECTYYCRTEDGRIAVHVTYVDDILLTGD